MQPAYPPGGGGDSASPTGQRLVGGGGVVVPAQPASGGGCLPQSGWAVCSIIRGRPAVRGERTYGGRPGQRVEEQGTWASQKHSEAGYGRPVDRGVWTAKTVKRPRQQPAHPQYANYWAPLTPKRHIPPHPAQPQHTNDWAPRTRKQHQQEHRPQRPSERSDPTQHAKGRAGDCPGPRKGATTRRNVTQGGGGSWRPKPRSRPPPPPPVLLTPRSLPTSPGRLPLTHPPTPYPPTVPMAVDSTRSLAPCCLTCGQVVPSPSFRVGALTTDMPEERPAMRASDNCACADAVV